MSLKQNSSSNKTKQEPDNSIINNKSNKKKRTKKKSFSPIYINLSKMIKLYFSPDKKYMSLCPILPTNRPDILCKLYDLSKLGIIKDKIEEILNSINNEKRKKKNIKNLPNGIETEKKEENIKITDEHFIQDCIVLSSKICFDNEINIANKISNFIFNYSVYFEYSKDKKIAKLRVGEKYLMESDISLNEKDAKKNVLYKFIKEYIPIKESTKIIQNLEESIKKAEQRKEKSKNKYNEFLKDCNGDRKLLKQKRKLPNEEFSQNLPYFNMFPKDKKDINNNPLLDDGDNNENEIFFVNTQNIPVNEILLGDLGIIDYHLNDFKYTPLRLYEMIRDSEKSRSVDFKMVYSQLNSEDYCLNNEATIISQKLGINVHGYGKTKNEAENKCALTCLFVLFKNKFKTFNELHEYFERKNGKYLDILLDNTCDNNSININNNKKKKEEEHTINLNNNESDISINTDNSKLENVSINFNDNLINNGISEINNSGYSSNNNSISSKQLVEALSSQDDKINELVGEKFDESLFFIKKEDFMCN